MFKKLATAAALAAVTASTASAHMMTPGYEKEFATSEVHAKQYTLTNKYDFPAEFEVMVFDKNFKPVDGWRTADKKTTWKLRPESERKFDLWFKMPGGDRKLIVCTVLKSVGYEGNVPGNISRVCSRLWLVGTPAK